MKQQEEPPIPRLSRTVAKSSQPHTAALSAADVPPPGTLPTPRPIILDSHRAFIFPNRIREMRTQHGFPTLLTLASALAEVPYIRLSKIERGEVMARPDEIVRIADLLGVAPSELLIDVEDPGFDIAAWSEPVRDGRVADQAEEEFAILLGAAARALRARTPELTIAAIERDFGIPPVILSRIENALKPLSRWNSTTIGGICRLFGVADAQELRRNVEEQYRSGALDDYVGLVADPAARQDKTRTYLARLRDELEQEPASKSPSTAAVTRSKAGAGEGAGVLRPVAELKLRQVRLLKVLGSPLPGGLVAPVETDLEVEAPRIAGPRAFGLRICRPTLGAGLPGNAIIVADPDAFPSAGGLAVVREKGNYRLLAITFDLNGAMIGHSLSPALEVPLDAVHPSDVAAVISASFI